MTLGAVLPPQRNMTDVLLVHEKGVAGWATPYYLKPQLVIRPILVHNVLISNSIYAISAILSADWPHPCLDAARYACDNNVANLLETNTNLTQILTTDLG